MSAPPFWVACSASRQSRLRPRWRARRHRAPPHGGRCRRCARATPGVVRITVNPTQDLRIIGAARARGLPLALGSWVRFRSLQLLDEHFRLLVESVRDYAIYLLAPDGTIQSWNAGAQRLKGYEPG